MKIGIHPFRHLTLIFFITNLIINFCAPNIFLNSANAVRKGQLTQTGKYALPVQSAKSWCSGVAISTRVVITAAHCTSANGVVYSDIKVGFAGSNQNDQSKRISVLEVITEPGFNNDDSRRVPKDDIAFLILSSDLPAVSITRIASESDISALRSKGEVLLLQGYGRLDEGTDNSTYATYPFNGYFSIDSTATFEIGRAHV